MCEVGWMIPALSTPWANEIYPEHLAQCLAHGQVVLVISLHYLMSPPKAVEQDGFFFLNIFIGV